MPFIDLQAHLRAFVYWLIHLFIIIIWRRGGMNPPTSVILGTGSFIFGESSLLRINVTSMHVGYIKTCLEVRTELAITFVPFRLHWCSWHAARWRPYYSDIQCSDFNIEQTKIINWSVLYTKIFAFLLRAYRTCVYCVHSYSMHYELNNVHGYRVA